MCYFRLIAGLLTIPWLLAPQAALPQGTASTFITGNELFARCTTNVSTTWGATDYAWCMGYVYGAVDAITAARAETGNYGSCFARGVNGTQIIHAVISYLESNPSRRHYAASILVGEAIGPMLDQCPTSSNP